MRKIIQHDKNQTFLFAEHRIGDRLPEDHEVYQFDKLISGLDKSAITHNYNSRGGALYDPSNMLAILIYGYFKGIDSSRKLQEQIAANLPFIYLAGGNQIKYHCICDFRKKHLNDFRSLLYDSIKLALNSGLVKKSALFSLDGSKIEADASGSKTKSKAEWEVQESTILEKVDEFLKKCSETDEAEDRLEESEQERMRKASAYLDKVLEKRKQRHNSVKNSEKNKQVKKTKNVKISNLSDCESGLKVCEQINDTFENNPSVSDKTLLNLTDQDCRIMKSDSTTKECFNAQIITNHQVIVAADVTNQENDQNQVEPMVEQLKENLALTSDSCEARDNHHEPSTENQSIHLAADAGYNQGKNLAYLDKEKNIDAFISMKNRKEEQDLESNPYHKDYFKYDEDHYICPERKTLEFHKDTVTDGKSLLITTLI